MFFPCIESMRKCYKRVFIQIPIHSVPIFYKEESTFIKYLDSFDIRFIGTDYIKGNYSAKDHKIEICWIDRNHNYSTTHLKNTIYNSITSKKKS